ncbi:MAG TPA: sensor domain-containing protein [Cellulomonas sp.]
MSHPQPPLDTGAADVPAVDPTESAPSSAPRPGAGSLWSRAAWVRTWTEQGYLSLALLLAPFGFGYVVVTVSFAASIAVTVVGLFLAGFLVLGGRAWAALYRGMARGMLGVDVPAPAPFRRGRGFWRSLGRLLGDVPGWRAMAFLLLAFPLSLVAAVVSWTFLAVGLAGVTHWAWYRWLPAQEASDGTLHRGAQLGTDFFIDTTPRQWLMIALGLVLLLVWQRLTLGFGHLFRLLTRLLLGPTRSSERVAHLEQTRGSAVLDADARLRRIERDLHDGTQARLVAVAMQVGEARELLTDPAGPPADAPAGTAARTPTGAPGLGRSAEAAALLGQAHTALKETLAELREIARGIHPPALDNGLALALETLAARCAVPVAVEVDLPEQPAPEVETIAYFVIAELLTNVVRHSHATRASVRAETAAGLLRLRVRDDGRGGARLALPGASGGTGLPGLVERVATVDGDLDIVSPPGGPTVVTVHLPMSVVR